MSPDVVDVVWGCWSVEQRGADNARSAPIAFAVTATNLNPVGPVNPAASTDTS